MASPSPAGGGGLLSGTRTRSYGSLTRSTRSPVRERRVEHQVQPGETLQGIALKYGVTMEQIKRANRLYTNDSIFLKKCLFIPMLVDPEGPHDKPDGEGEGTGQSQAGERGEDRRENAASANGRTGGRDGAAEETSELSAMDFLKKIDGMISQSKQAAAKKIREGGKGAASSQHRVGIRSSGSSPRMHQHRATLGPVPLTVTKRTRGLREREDEIFEL
ncbi:LYSM1 protein, partial [Amia calva]|nr:LYSM1 protein [Amia calva]